MKADELYTLLNDLPDDYVTQAAGTHRQSRKAIYIVIPALAACITLLIAAAVYPKLRTQMPERTEDSVYTDASTAAVTTESAAAEQENPVTTKLTAAKPEQTVTTASQTAQTTGTVTAAPQTVTASVTTAAPQHTEQEPVKSGTVTTTDYSPWFSVPESTTAAQAVTRPQTSTTAVSPQECTVEDPEPGTKEPCSEAENPGSPPQTIPYVLGKRRTELPYSSQTGIEIPDITPETVPVPATTIGTDCPTTHPNGSEECTTSTQPQQQSGAEPGEPEVRREDNIIRITPARPYKDAALEAVSIDKTCVLNVTLLCLDGNPPANDTVQIYLVLPRNISEQITDTEVQILETFHAARFAAIADKQPVLYSFLKKEDDP